MDKMSRIEALLHARDVLMFLASTERAEQRRHENTGRHGLAIRHGLRAQQHERAAVLLQEILDELKGAGDADR